MRVDKRWWVVAAIAVGVALFAWFDASHYLSLDYVKAQQAQLEAWRSARPIIAALAAFAIYVGVTALSLPGAAVMTVVMGAVFGLLWGTVIVSFAF